MGWGSGWWGGQGECERRIEVFVKIQKNSGGGSGGGGGGGRGLGRGGGLFEGVRVDVNEVLYNIKKMKKCGGGRGRGNI